MASDGDNRILSLDNVTCSMVFLDVPKKGDWLKEKQRTLTLTKPRGHSQDECILEVFDKKHKLQLKQSVVFCGIIRYSSQHTSKKKLELRKCFDLLFTQLTAVIVFRVDASNDQKLYEYCLKRSGESFNHVITRCADLISHPPSCVPLRDCRQVLLCLTSSRLTLCSANEPHKCIVNWPLDRLLPPKLEGDVLNVQVEGEGSYKLSSRVDKHLIEDVNRHLRKYLNLDDTYLEPVASSPATEPVYLEVSDELVCEKCRQLYQSYFERGDDDQLDTYNTDLNEYVTSRLSLYKRLVRTFLDADAGYITTCTYKCNDNRQTAAEQDGYIKMDGKKGTFSDVEGGYLTTCTNKGSNNRESVLKQGDSLNMNVTNGNTLKERPVEMDDKLATEGTPCLEVHQRSVSNDYQTHYSSPDEEHSEPISGQETSESMKMLLGTLHDVLYSRPPSKDTLQLSRQVRFQLCIKLYQKSAKTVGTCMEDWQLFADKIGLTAEAVNLISIVVKNHSLPQPAGELVLRHWQHVYNKHGETDEAGPCPYACNKENLIKILEELGREDLIKLIK